MSDAKFHGSRSLHRNNIHKQTSSRSFTSHVHSEQIPEAYGEQMMVYLRMGSETEAPVASAVG